MGIIIATDGSGCGLLGMLGNREDALYKLKQKAEQAGADYVHIYKSVKPYSDGKCRHNSYTVEGYAYRTNSVARKEGKFQLPQGQIPIVNPGFESDLLEHKDKTGWHYKLVAWQGKKCGVVNVDHYTSMYPLYGPAEGNNMAFLAYPGSYMQQTLNARLQKDSYYHFRMFVGRRAERAFGPGNYEVLILAGNKLVASKRERTPAAGSYEESTISFKTDRKTAGIGKPLKLVLKNINARQINFDDLAFYTWPVAQGADLPKRFANPTTATEVKKPSVSTAARSDKQLHPYLKTLPEDADLNLLERQLKLKEMNMYVTKSGDMKPISTAKKRDPSWKGTKTQEPQPGNFSAPNSDKPITIDIRN